MEAALDILNYAFTAIMIGVAGTWTILIKSIMDSFTRAPYLDRFENTATSLPKVSVILPARNEERFIERCLDSLLDQDYANYEIVVIDDSSDDSTGEIISRYVKKDMRVVPVTARTKPDGWMGKNWACMEGYRRATGELLLFTDADTIHSRGVISSAVAHLVSLKLDALSAIPKILTFDFWTRITLPMITTFLHGRYSALNVNNPSKKIGYFFGSFFIMKKSTYEEVGMHESVRQEIIEDEALGKKVKETGFKLRMVRGDHMIQAVWARDKATLWNALKRLMIPMYLQSGGFAVGAFVAVLFLLFVPFAVLTATVTVQPDMLSSKILGIAAATASGLIYTGGIIEVRVGLRLRLAYAAFAPLGSLVVVLGFLSGLLQAKGTSSVTWRGRSYSVKDHARSRDY